MTQMIKARQGIITPEMEKAAAMENVPVEVIRAGLADGTIVIPANVNHTSLEP